MYSTITWIYVYIYTYVYVYVQTHYFISYSFRHTRPMHQHSRKLLPVGGQTLLLGEGEAGLDTAVWVCVCVCMCICMCACVYMYIYIYISASVHVYVCVCVCLCVFVLRKPHSRDLIARSYVMFLLRRKQHCMLITTDSKMEAHRRSRTMTDLCIEDVGVLGSKSIYLCLVVHGAQDSG